MKKTLAFLSVSFVLFSASCSKKNEDVPGPGGNGPDVLLPINGFLVCIGKNSDNHSDTMTFYFKTSGQQMTIFGRQFLRAADEIFFTTNSDGTVNIKRKEPYVHNNVNYDKFGIEENKNPSVSEWPSHKYLWTMFQKDETMLNRFIVKRDPGDMKKFTIESKAFPGYYLGVAKWKNATYPTTDQLVFTGTPVVWWFEQK